MRCRALDATARGGRGVVLATMLAACSLVPAAAAARDIQPERLTGEAFLGGATPVDPPPGEPADTHAYVSITGAAARRLYGALPGPATPDACEPGRRTKRAGHLTCSAGRRASDARCDFSIVLSRGELAAGPPC